MSHAIGKDGGPTIIIIGAGTAGLLTAQALKLQGAKVVVYEQDKAIDTRPRDWNFGVYWAHSPLKECLPEHLIEQVENAQVDDRRAGTEEVIPAYHGVTEELLQPIPVPNMLRLARRRFIRVISQGIEIEYGKRLKRVSTDGKTATAHFEDGTTASGDLLIGADSAHSVVRDFLVGPEKARLTPVAVVSTICMPKLPAEAATRVMKYGDRMMISFHPNGHFFWIGLHDAHGDSKPGEWTFMVIVSWIPSEADYDPKTLQNDEILADLKSRAEPFSDEFRYLLQSIPDGTKCWHNRLSHWIPEGWDNRNGTVTLVGDAAHPMTIHRGQGLNNAVEDVAALTKEIKEQASLAAAVNAYERSMIPRAQEAVKMSTENSLMLHDWQTLLQSPLFTHGIKQKA